MSQPPRPFTPAMPAGRARLLPAVSVMLGSLVPILPTVAPAPLLPPCGLLMLLGWRLLRHDVFRIWAPLPLGAFDDLVSGQPLGSAMLTWGLCFVAIDLVDRRLPFRDFWQDWAIAAGCIAVAQLVGRLLASPLSAQVDIFVVAQIIIAIALFPLALSACASLDRRRSRG